MNFTNLYYPTAEQAYEDPNFIQKVLADSSLEFNLSLTLLGSPCDIKITFLNKILFEGQLQDKIDLDQKLDLSDVNWDNGELTITSTNNLGSIKLTKCKVEHFDMLEYPISEHIHIIKDHSRWINTELSGAGKISLSVSNPINLWAMEIKKFNPNAVNIVLEHDIIVQSQKKSKEELVIALKKLII